MSSEERWADLVEDLEWVGTDRLVRRAYLQAQDADQRAHSTLAEVVINIVGDAEWRARPNRSLTETILAAISKLPEKLEQPEPTEKGNRERIPIPSVGRPERHLAEVLYGYADGEVATRLGISQGHFKYSQYVEVAKYLAGIETYSEGTIKRLTRAIRQDLADVLLEMERRAIKVRRLAKATASKSIAVWSPVALEIPFIPRLILEGQFHHLWNTEVVATGWHRPNIICLVGEPGTGKSRFARELPALSDAVWINAAPDAFSFSLADVLDTYGIPLPSLEPLALKRAFAKLLSRSDGPPPLVVIDGISDPEEIDDYLPQTTRTRLVITSRTRPADDWSPVLQVGEMTLEEATALVKSLLPAAGDGEAISLAASLGCRPLAIVQASASFRRSSSSSVASFLRTLARDSETAFGKIAERSDKTLSKVYRKMLADLRVSDLESYEILRLLAFVPPLYAPRNLVIGWLAHHVPVAEASEREYYDDRYTTALNPLRQLCLVEETNLGVRLNSLTQEMLRTLLWQEGIEVLDHHYGTTTSGIDTADLERADWSLREIASLSVIQDLLTHRVVETVDAKDPSPRTGRRSTRNARFLTADEWSALTEALWERRYRVAAIEHLMHFEGEISEDELSLWLQPHVELVQREAARIPKRGDWEARATAFDWFDFTDWMRKHYSQAERAAILARLIGDPVDELPRLVILYSEGRTIWALRADPVVETRLGRFDLREMYGKSEQEDSHDPYRLSNPPVVLGLEDEGERSHAQLTLHALGCADASDLLRVVKLSSTDGADKLALWMTMMPIGLKRIPGTRTWSAKKPFTTVILAANPQGQLATAELTEEIRQSFLADTYAVLQAQGVTHPDPSELDKILTIRTWQEPCYEFAHFTDEELADGIIAVHDTIDGWSKEELLTALQYWRSKRQDIELVWLFGRWDERSGALTDAWASEVSKPKLAEALWPVLERKIQRSMTDPEAPVPPILQAVRDAYQMAQRRRDTPFIITEEPPALGDSSEQ